MPAASTGPNIAHCHDDYSALLPKWRLIHAFVSGADSVRALRELVLPKPNAADTSTENTTRYDQYIERACFYPAVARTLEGYNGQVFSDPPVVRLPESVKRLEMDVDGAGVSLVQQSSKALNHVIAFGRCGLLADFPATDGMVTREQMTKGNIRPTVTLVQPFDIVNWRLGEFGGVTKLIRLVISEKYVTNDDGFEQKLDNSWRVLYLNDAGEVVIELWREKTDKKGEFEIIPAGEEKLMRWTPMVDGKPLTEIPFTFVGSENNDSSCDLPPMDGLTELNRAHFRNSADYEESVYQTGQPTYWMSGLDSDWLKEQLGGKVLVGSRTIIPLPPDGQMGIAQAKPNTLAFEAMTHKEKQMVAIGAKLIEMSKVAMTAFEAGLHDGASSCALARMANNVSQAYEWIIRRAMQFVDSGWETAELQIRLSTDFRTNDLTPSDQAQMVANWQAGAITDDEMRDQFKRGSMTSATTEEWKTWYEAKKKEEEAQATLEKKVTQPKKETSDV
jgi:hypothetical protein